MADNVYLNSGELVGVDLDSSDLNLNLNLFNCVGKNSPFINFGTTSPDDKTPGRIYIQIQE